MATQRLLLRLWDGRLPGRAPWAHLPGQLPEGGLGPGAGSQELSHWVRGGWALRAGACVGAHPAPVVEATITLSSHAIYLRFFFLIFTMFCLTTTRHSYTYIRSVFSLPPLRCPTPLGHHGAPDWAPCVTEQLLTGHLFYT